MTDEMADAFCKQFDTPLAWADACGTSAQNWFNRGYLAAASTPQPDVAQAVDECHESCQRALFETDRALASAGIRRAFTRLRAAIQQPPTDAGDRLDAERWRYVRQFDRIEITHGEVVDMHNCYGNEETGRQNDAAIDAIARRLAQVKS